MAAERSKNIYFVGQNKLELKEELLPELGVHEVRVRAKKSLISTGTESICFGRKFEAGTHWDSWVKYPFAPGYSLVGEVVALGAGVSSLALGARVAVRKPHHQFVTVNEEAVFPIAEGVNDEDAAFFALAKIVQNGVRRAGHVLGERIVVVGLGLLGQLVTSYVRLLGAREVIAIDVSATRLELAKKQGATVTLQMGVEDALEEVRALTQGKGADVVYEVTGSARVLNLALPLVKKLGKLILLGDSGRPSEQRLSHHVVTQGLQIVGAHDSNPPVESTDHVFWSHQEMTQLFFEYVARGDMRVADLLSHRYNPNDAQEAYEMLERERMSAMGVLFAWESL